MLFQTSMCLFVLLYTKDDIWKNVLIKQISFPIDYHSMYFLSYSSQWGMRSVSLQNKETHRGLEQHEGESFLEELTL